MLRNRSKLGGGGVGFFTAYYTGLWVLKKKITIVNSSVSMAIGTYLYIFNNEHVLTWGQILSHYKLVFMIHWLQRMMIYTS